jgi:acetyltransferase-like isoleucine patch superfamily enzyme
LSNVYEVGRGTYGNPKVSSWKEIPRAIFKVGAFCSFAEGVQIFLGGEHNINWITTFPFCSFDPVLFAATPGHPKTKGDITIGNDVWVGSQAIILSGVTISDGAVIGARALVSKDVAPYSVVVGNPAYEVKKRFDEDKITYLLKLQWWNWDDDMIEEVAPILLSEDFDKLKEYAASKGVG